MPRLGGALDIAEISAPTTPVAGRSMLYFLSDGLLYSRNSAGTIRRYINNADNESIGGNKTFTGTIVISNGDLTISNGDVLARNSTASTGYSALRAGNTVQSGYVAFHGTNAIRSGYIGYSPVATTIDQGQINYIAGLHNFRQSSGTVGQNIAEFQVALAAPVATISATGVITASSLALSGTTSQVLQGNGVPSLVSGVHISSTIKDPIAGTAGLRTLGTGAQQAVAGTDARLSDARTPTAHAHPVTDLTATGTRDATTYLRGDNTWAAPASGSAQNPIVSVEVNVTAALGDAPARSGRFTISDISFLAGQELYIQQSADLITGKGTRADESEMDYIIPRGIITSAGVATVYWSSNTYIRGLFRFNYRSS